MDVSYDDNFMEFTAGVKFTNHDLESNLKSLNSFIAFYLNHWFQFLILFIIIICYYSTLYNDYYYMTATIAFLLAESRSDQFIVDL